MEKTRTPVSTERSAEPMPGLSKRAQEQLRSRSFNVYSKARQGKK